VIVHYEDLAKSGYRSVKRGKLKNLAHFFFFPPFFFCFFQFCDVGGLDRPQEELAKFGYRFLVFGPLFFVFFFFFFQFCEVGDLVIVH